MTASKHTKVFVPSDNRTCWNLLSFHISSLPAPRRVDSPLAPTSTSRANLSDTPPGGLRVTFCDTKTVASPSAEEARTPSEASPLSHQPLSSCRRPQYNAIQTPPRACEIRRSYNRRDGQAGCMLCSAQAAPPQTRYDIAASVHQASKAPQSASSPPQVWQS